MNEEYGELLERAIAIAIEAHKGQKRRTGAPYVLHPLRLMLRFRSPLEQITAVLHDVVEDSAWKLEDLRREGFPEMVIEAVDCLTKRDGEKYETFVSRAAANPLARKIKLADLEDNMDCREFPEITPEHAERLDKYLKAWRSLQEASKS